MEAKIKSKDKTETNKNARSSKKVQNNARIDMRSQPSTSSNCNTGSSKKAPSRHANGRAAVNQKSSNSTKPQRDRNTAPGKGSFLRESSKDEEDLSNVKEMTTTHLLTEDESLTLHGNAIAEQETNVDSKQDQETDNDESSTLLNSSSTEEIEVSRKDSTNRKTSRDSLPSGWKQLSDKLGVYYWNEKTGMIKRNRPDKELREPKDSLVLYHDDEEINQASVVRRASSEEDDLLESGAALTLADDSIQTESIEFVVYPVGCCEFDETQLVSANNTRAIQKCILRLANKPTKEETMCWGLGRTQPILMRLLEDHIQFTDIKSQLLIRSQPIRTIKTWAVDDDNNFAFVVEDRPHGTSQSIPTEPEFYDPVDYALLSGPTLMCYVFNSMDDDDMSCRVAAKLNDEINRYREQMSNRISKSLRIQQMVAQPTRDGGGEDDQTDADEDLADMEESNEMTLAVRYIGKVEVPRPTGIDVLNVAIDKCLADASRDQLNRIMNASGSQCDQTSELSNDDGSPLIDASLHVLPSSIIVENITTGEIIVECRIRYLTFIGISRRDIRWCGFIMQNTINKTFVAHCFECHPTAAFVCDAMQASCAKMYEKMIKSQRKHDDATSSIIPGGSKIRDTLAKTLSRMKLTPNNLIANF